MKSVNFFKDLEARDNDEKREEQERIDKIVKEELAKRMSREQLNDMEFNEKLKQNFDENGGKTCIICLSNPPSMAFIPCGHKNICSGCKNVFKAKTCPLCRADISGIIKIYET